MSRPNITLEHIDGEWLVMHWSESTGACVASYPLCYLLDDAIENTFGYNADLEAMKRLRNELNESAERLDDEIRQIEDER